MSIAGKKYGYGNYNRQRLICNNLIAKSCTLEHYVITDKDFVFEKSYEQFCRIKILNVNYLLEVLREKKINIVMFDLFGFWCAHKTLYLPKLYKKITEKNKNVMVVGFDDIRYVDALLDIKNFISFISNGPADDQDYLTSSNIFIGFKYHVFNPLILKFKKNLPTKKKGIVVAISGSDENKVTEFVCAALAKIKPSEKVTVFVGQGVSKVRIKHIANLCLQFDFLFHSFSDFFYEALSNAKYLICGEGTIKFDGLALGVKTMVFAQSEVESLPLNNFFLTNDVQFLGSMNNTPLDDLTKQIRDSISNDYQNFDFHLNGNATDLIVDQLLKHKRDLDGE